VVGLFTSPAIYVGPEWHYSFPPQIGNREEEDEAERHEGDIVKQGLHVRELVYNLEVQFE